MLVLSARQGGAGDKLLHYPWPSSAEPYGGKGVRYSGEVIRRKAGKAAKGKTK